MTHQPSLRAQLVTRRTYNRPKSEDESSHESWEETVDRVIDHQRWLWQREGTVDEVELEELRELMLERKMSVSGRTLWLGGTNVAKKREASQFNCSFTHVESVYDVVDILWLLLQGCGVGFRPIIGSLNGFVNPIKDIEVIRSKRTEKGGKEHNYHKSTNGTIIPKALFNYYAHDTPIRETVEKENNIHEFLYGIKKRKGFVYWLIKSIKSLLIHKPFVNKSLLQDGTNLLICWAVKQSQKKNEQIKSNF